VATADPAGDLTTRFGGVYRRSLPGNPSSLDPAYATDIYAYTVVNQLFDGLVQFDSHLNPVPAIAGFWEASVDGQVWIFYLRKGVRFHNGREVTAEDFVYSFTRLLDPAVRSPATDSFKYIRGVEAFQAGTTPRVEGLQAPDRYTLRISLKEPYAPFLSALAMSNAKVVPREEVEKLGEQFGRHPVGSGPFAFVRWEQRQEIVLQAYNFYYEGRPFLDQIVFQISTDKQFEEDFATFLKGELEETVVPSSQGEEIRKNPRYRPYTYLTKPLLHLLYIGLNTQKAPFTDRKVRQAFNYAINRKAIVEEIRQGVCSVPAKGILPPGMPGYDPDLVGYYYSPRRAKQLLAEAGYPGGKGIPVLELWFSSKEDTVRKELEAYQEDLAELGITVEIHQAADWPTFMAILEEKKPAMFRLAWYSDIPDPDNFFYPLLFSQSKINRTSYRNPEVDRLLEEARGRADYQQRIRLYRDIEQLVLDDAPWISQHHSAFEYLYQPYVQGIETNALGAHYILMKKVWLERLKDQKMSTREKSSGQ
jgi:peptide/nickel transport system substrate-binding protein/oligopeptide transport system substrate-binding protein